MIFLIVPVLALMPAIFWFFIFLKEDRSDPEPKRLIIKLFLLGILSGFAAAILEFGISSLFPASLDEVLVNFFEDPTPGLITPKVSIFIITAIVIFAAVEEILKILVVRKFIYNHTHFRQVVDGAIFGISAGLGFATLENLGYFFETSFSDGLAALVIVFFLRFFASTLLHALTTGIAGYYLGKAKFSNNKSVFWQGLLAAILIHAAFNLFLFGGEFGIIINIVFLAAILIFLLKRMESVEAQTIWGLVLLRKSEDKNV